MFLFVTLCFVGGLLMVFLDTIYFIFATAKYKKYKSAEPKNYSVLVRQYSGLVYGGVAWYFIILLFVWIPLSAICADKILNSSDNTDLSILRRVWFVVLFLTRLYWTMQFMKIKKEVDTQKPPLPPGTQRKIKWF